MARQGSTAFAIRWFGFLIAVTFTVAVSGQTRTKPTATPSPSNVEGVVQPSPQASPLGSPDASIIGMPQIADEAMQLDQRLRTLPDRLASESFLAEIEQEVNQLRETTSEKTRETETAIQSGAILAELQQSLLDWQSLNKQVARLADTLTKQATSVEADIRSLRDDQSRWQRTYDQMVAEASPPELLELTGKAVDDIGASLTLAEEQRTRIVALQQAVAAQGAIVAGEIENLRKAMARSQRSLLEPDSPPLWKIQFRAETDESTARLLRKSYARDVTRLRNFVSAKSAVLLGIALLTMAAFALFVRLSKRAKSRSPESAGSADPGNVFRRPASLALLGGVVATMPLLYDAPISVRGLIDLLFVAPVVRLLMPRLTSPFRKMLVALIASVLTWALIKFLQVPIWIKRDLLAVFCVAIVAVFLWLAHSARRDNAQLQRGPATVIIAVHAGVLLMVVSFFANIFGYFGLSDLVGNATLVSAYRAVALYAVFVVGTSIISFILQSETTRHLATLRTGADQLARRLSFALGLILLLLWFHTALNLFAIREDFYGAIKAALNYQITIGSASFAFSNIVAFVLTLFFGYLIATVTRAILGEEILPRLKLAHGLPNAIATITHYVALVLVFLLALAAAGVELSKFTILTGAFGVGLGFGLQNVVNNFVSGLILLFERPVRLGDFLEIGGVSGKVTKIGFRSSTLHVFDGSDLIIPNANLLSQQVTNWTLTGTRRQVFLTVFVAYGNDPTHVRDLLRETAAAHPDVLDYPKPTALFLGFGDSALNFEVRFWAPRPEIVPELKSDVALSIAAALSEAGIKVPIPQRDLHIKSIDQATGEAVAFPANERKGRGSNSTDPTNADAIDNVNDRERTT